MPQLTNDGDQERHEVGRDADPEDAGEERHQTQPGIAPAVRDRRPQDEGDRPAADERQQAVIPVVPRPQTAGTASMLNTAEPTTAPTPRSPFVTNVPTQLMNSSGLDEAAAMNVAPATSSFTCSSMNRTREANNKPTDLERAPYTPCLLLHISSIAGTK
uniref:Uncharacterized protein n=1 Tax=Anopheles atroparvus TaxID=41427 RepID=A0A182IUW8_ANOAO